MTRRDVEKQLQKEQWKWCDFLLKVVMDLAIIFAWVIIISKKGGAYNKQTFAGLL